MKKFVLILVLPMILLSCTSEKTKNLASQVYETEEDRTFNQDERIKELTRDIKKLEDELEETLEKYQKVGNFHRAMGLKMMHYKMFFKAYEHFDKALEFYPNSEMLHYYRGIAASQYALSRDQEYIRQEYLDKAKYSHEYSIKLNPRFTKGLYALSILYIYEYDIPHEAKPLLDRLLMISTREFDAMLLRALLHQKDGEWEEALDLADSVLELSENSNHILRADTIRDNVLSRIAGE